MIEEKNMGVMSDRARAFGFLAAGLAGVLVVIAFVIWRADGKGDGDSSSAAPASTLAATTTAPVASTALPQQEPHASLAAILPLTLDGYRIDTGAKATGSLDIDSAVAAETDTHAERALLETRHFESGYGRAFTNDKTDVYIIVYDFAGEQDASLYLADGFITLTGRGASVYDVPEVPGARGFSQGTESDARPVVVHGVGFSKRDRFVLVFTRSASQSTPTQAKQLALTLYPHA